MYEGLGDRQRTLEWLDTAARGALGASPIHGEPRFASFTNEPAFRELLRNMSLPEHGV